MEPSHCASLDPGENGHRVWIDGSRAVVSQFEHYATEAPASSLRTRPRGGSTLGEANLSHPSETGQTAWGQDILFGRGGVSVRSGSGANLWSEGQNSSSDDLRSAPEPQRHQRRQCTWGVLGRDLHWQVERGIVRGFLAEFHGQPDRKDIPGG